MQDLETKSLWSQIAGESIMGDMEGTKLTLFNSSHSTFAEFKKQYPHGKMLKKPEKGEAVSHYNKYFADSTRLGIFGRLDNFERLPAKAKVFGLRLAGKNIAIGKKYLSEKNYTFINNNTDNILIVYDNENNTVSAFKLTDKSENYSVSSGSITSGDMTWNAFTGERNGGEGAALEQVPVITAFWFAWASFFPETELIK